MRRLLFSLAPLLAFALLGPPADIVVPRAKAQQAPAKRKRKRFLKVRRIKPKHGKTFVDPAVELRVRFNRAIDVATITPGAIRLETLSGFRVDWSYRLEKKGKLLIITPLRLLDAGTDYRLALRPPLASFDARPLKREKVAQFFTDPSFRSPPYVTQDQFSVMSTRLSVGRAYHSHCVMSNGDILFAGGQADFDEVTGNTTLSNNGEYFDIAANRVFAANTPMHVSRAFQPAAGVAGGAIVIGGWNGEDATSSTDVFNRTTGRFTPGPSMVEKRDFHAAVQLEDGRVLVTGGLSYAPGGALFSDTAEIYDPAVGSWRLTHGNPVRRRGGHALTLLPDGRVLISGGEPPGTAGGTVEYFDPATETFRAGLHASGSGRQNHALAQIYGQGNLLFADGGSALVEFFNPFTEQFQGAGVSSVAVRSYSTASALPDGKVLIVGGFDRTNPNDTLALRSVDLYVPGLGDVGRVVNVNIQTAEPRAGHSAHVLPNGNIIIVGGVGTESPVSLSSIELFTPRESE